MTTKIRARTHIADIEAARLAAPKERDAIADEIYDSLCTAAGLSVAMAEKGTAAHLLYEMPLIAIRVLQTMPYWVEGKGLEIGGMLLPTEGDQE